MARERRKQRRALLVTTGASAKDMQPIAKLAFFQVANKTIDARDRLCRRCGSCEPEIVLNTGRARFIASFSRDVFRGKLLDFYQAAMRN